MQYMRTMSAHSQVCAGTCRTTTLRKPQVYLLTYLGRACRSLWAGLLGSLAALPPAAAAEVVAAVHARIAGAGQTVPPRLRAEPFGDAALGQVCACYQGQP